MPKSSYLIFYVCLCVLTAACGETLLAEGGSYCTPSAEQRSEDCYLNDGEPVVVEDVSDLDPICSTSCNKIRELRISGRNVAGLTNLEALRGISVESVDFTGVPDLRTTRGLSLANGARILLQQNPSLEEFVVGTPLEQASRIEMQSNASLRSLDALSNLQHFGETGEARKLHLLNLPISDLSVFHGLELIGNTYFLIRNLDSLKSLPSLKGTAATIQIQVNDELFDISGLTSLEQISYKLTVSDNPKLKNCEARRVAEQITFGDDAQAVIRENGTGSCE
jgi:hypothetical protein